MLFLTPKGLQMLVLGLHMMKMVLRKIFQIHQSLYLHTHPMVNGFSSCINHIFLKSCQYIKKLSNMIQFVWCSQLILLFFLMEAPALLLTLCGLLWAQSPPCSPPVVHLQMRAGPKRSRLKSGLKRSLWMWRCTRHPWVTCPPLLCLITQCSLLL